MTSKTSTITKTSTQSQTAAVERFLDLQGKLLAYYSVDATSRFVQITKPQMRVHLLEAGEGEPIVILHGGDGEAVDWAPLLAPLQHHAHLFAVDRPGNGLSDPFDYRHVELRRHAVEFVTSVLDALGLRRATLLAGSMGGFFALATALDRPERVERVILAGYAVGMTSKAPLPLRLIGGVPGLSRLFMRGRPTMEAQKKQYQQMFHIDPSTVPELYFETRIAGIELPSAQGTWAAMLPRIVGLRGIRREVDLSRELGKISQPTLLLLGEHDMAPIEAGRAAAAHIPNCEFEPLPRVGHFPFLESPDQCTRLIVDFMASSATNAGIRRSEPLDIPKPPHAG